MLNIHGYKKMQQCQQFHPNQIKCILLYVLVMMKVLPVVKVCRVMFWLRQCKQTVESD